MEIGPKTNAQAFKGTLVIENEVLARSRIEPDAWERAIADSGTGLRRTTPTSGDAANKLIAGPRAFDLVDTARAPGQPHARTVFKQLHGSERIFEDAALTPWHPGGGAAAPITDAKRAAAQVADEATDALPEAGKAAARGVMQLKAVRVGAPIVAGLAAVGIGIAALTRRSADGEQPVSGGGPAATGKSRAQIAAVAKSQLGTVDTSDGKKIDERVAEYTKSVDGAKPSVDRDWSTDFVSWVADEAGTPIGPDGAGVASVDDLTKWAKSADVLDAGTPKFDADAPQADVGKIIVLGSGSTQDVGVVVAASKDTLEIVQGNRASGTELDGGGEAGVVATVKVNRDDPIVTATIDPAKVAKAEEKPPAEPKPEPKAEEKPEPKVEKKPPVEKKPKEEKPKVDPNAGKPIKGVAPPKVEDMKHPTPKEISDYFDWAIAQYADSPEEQKDLETAMKNLAAGESNFRINAMNMWDSTALAGKPTYGLFQYIITTFEEFQPKAAKANPDAWKYLGEVTYSDWRHQALTTAWALAEEPTDASRQRTSGLGQHGRYWTHWYAFKDMNNRGIDPTTSDHWKGVLNNADIDMPHSDAATYTNASPRRPSQDELEQVAKTGRINW